jgi:hypothetical protein
MRTLLTYLPALGCLTMMLIVCGPMIFRRNKGDASVHNSTQSTSSSQEIAQLREEVAVLKAQITLKEQSDSEPNS